MLKKIKFRWKEKELEGILLPSPEKGRVVVKLDSGYNIEVDEKDIEVVESTEIEKGEEKELEKAEGGEISLLGFGGTISSKVDYETGAVSPTISARELKKSFPELEKIASVDVKQVMEIFSEEMSVEHWEAMAETVYEELKEKEGVVVLHGTDTLGYSAAALSFAIRTPKPVVLVGAQRSSDRPSSDNKLNLLSAVFSAKQDFGEVVVCMHANTSDEFCLLHRGTCVRKDHSSRRDAFRSHNIRELARVHWKGYFEEIEGLKKRAELKLDNSFNDNVALIYAYPGMKGKQIEALSEYDGVVIAGTGLGHVSLEKVGKEIGELVESGLFVYMTTQTEEGPVNLNVYSTGRKLQEMGVEGNMNTMLPETAYVKLCWALGHTKKREEVAEIMKRDIAGELTGKLKYI
ncbi:MAG: Glu-tRNA(Gln) amidotransferase GatDE subunit D [Methanobacteriota archaeon]|nr:MAG: Glu-tRNA(Gln) amidotransferase GatDE subunit D [Euryarchaeota archaeon]